MPKQTRWDQPCSRSDDYEASCLALLHTFQSPFTSLNPIECRCCGLITNECETTLLLILHRVLRTWGQWMAMHLSTQCSALCWKAALVLSVCSLNLEQGQLLLQWPVFGFLRAIAFLIIKIVCNLIGRNIDLRETSLNECSEPTQD
jgi:hypothetical protein